MKPQSASFPVVALFAAMLASVCPPFAQAAPGEVDLAFTPTVAHDPGFYFVTTAGSQLFAYSSTNVYRILPDGQVDPQWQPQGPFDSPVFQFGGFPTGDWFALTAFSISKNLYLGSADGSFRRVTATASGFWSAFPQADGSLIIAGQRPQRIRPDGSVDPGYGATLSWKSAPFRGSGGGPQLVWNMDSQGRLILGGNFIRVGQHPRMGLVRLLADGRVDPQWNPGAALGVGLPEDGFLSACPISLSAGPDDSVLVGVGLAAAPGPEQSGRRLAWISAAGEVTGSFPAWGSFIFPPPAVQPDGRFLLWGAEELTHWNGTPVNGLIRINRDGSLDPTWNVSLTNAVDGYVALTGLTLDSTGGAVLAGRFTHVNGVARPGLARVFAYDPFPIAPAATAVLQQSRVTTNEVLRLTAAVTGFPPPNLQWLRNGEPIPGATNRGLALPVAGAESVGEFSLRSSNRLGVHTLAFPTVALTSRSPVPGMLDGEFNAQLDGFRRVRQVLSLPEGKLLIAGGDFYPELNIDDSLLTRLARDGTPDSGFGEGGVVRGVGFVESVRLLADGGILVAGNLTRLGGADVSGLAELNPDGIVRPKAYPALDTHHATAALKLPDGRYAVAGLFNRAGSVNVFRLARLTADLAVDSTFAAALEYWQVVADLALDGQGRLLIAGGGVAWDGGGSITDPAPIGVRRLLENGAFDPAFASDPRVATRLWVEPDGTILAGIPVRRINDRGEVVELFETQTGLLQPLLPGSLTDHRLVRLADGRVVGDLSRGFFDDPVLARWAEAGRRDFGFSVPLAYDRTAGIRRTVEAAEALPDGSVILAIQTSSLAGGEPRRLVRVLPDSDRKFTPVSLSPEALRATVRTQLGRHYTVRQRGTLKDSAPTPVAELTGDGYWQEVSVPATGASGFLELRVE